MTCPVCRGTGQETRQQRTPFGVMQTQTTCSRCRGKGKIIEKDDNLVGNMASEGTTPRQLTDLIGSLCDLTSGSGDKGTPIVFIQGYFDNYTMD